VSILVLDNVGLGFADRTLFADVGLRIAEGDRIGLIGPNGSGKTTLLRIIAGQQLPDRGEVQVSRGVSIGYLPQDIAVEGGRSLREFVLSSVPGRQGLEEAVLAAEAELEACHKDGGDDAALMEAATRIAELHERITHFEQFFSEHHALRILAGLGFHDRDHDRDLGEFSGGWKMRAVLAALLFQKPDLLLLDEPTNHLDMPSVAWFSEFLKAYKRAFVLISHDREFLNEQIARVVSLEPEGVRQYSGNLDRYQKQRAEEETILANKAKNLERERERLQRFVDRFRAQANKAAAVQSRVKALEKMEDVELYQKRKVMRFTFPPTSRTVAEVVRIEGLRKAFGDLVVFPNLSMTVRRGQRIAIIGANGAGKTTLLKMIAGELPADAGTISLGTGVEVGYYAQHHADTLHRDATVMQEVQNANPDASVGRVRSVLGAFLFSGDAVDKPIAVLSGGERARVALARLLIRPGNVLLMDEPSNHLDLESTVSLAESLATFDGTLIFVSHNRALVRALATTIWNVENGTVEDYPGTLDEYMYSCRLRLEASDPEPSSDGTSSAPAAAQAPATEPPKRRSREADKERKRKQAEARKLRSERIGPVQDRVSKLEKRIEELEAQQSARSAELADPEVYDDASRRNTLLSDFQKAQDKLDELTARWESASEELERAEAELAELEADPS